MTVTPIKLPAHEQDVLDRIAAEGNTLGWKPWKRDERGVALLKSDHDMGNGKVRRSVVELTPRGMAYHKPFVCDASS